ncbi:hypothetical protein ACFLWA_03715 [Chloroflexota bacterium]
MTENEKLADALHTAERMAKAWQNAQVILETLASYDGQDVLGTYTTTHGNLPGIHVRSLELFDNLTKGLPVQAKMFEFGSGYKSLHISALLECEVEVHANWSLNFMPQDVANRFADAINGG